MFNLISLKNGLENVNGFYFGGLNAGFKTNGDNDLGFIRSDEPVQVCAIFTSNKFKAAPIRHFLRYGNDFKTNFILLNSKNANAMTGKEGINDIDDIFKELSKKLNLINPIMSSTGVIGYRLKKDKIIEAANKFDFNSRNSDATVRAIMTTDSFKKEIAFRVELEDGKSFNIACICKGAGMINPAFATMLCFILTDADIPKSDMDELLKASVEESFNAVSVDGDTSTNDTLMLLSSQKSGVYDKTAFKFALETITKTMALNLVKDGEGSTKVVAFEVNGALNNEQAMKAAKALSNSLLVKTAIFGEDPNWGRIASTIGASGIECDDEKLSIYYDDVLVFDKDHPELDEISEEKAHKVMTKDSYKIRCEIGLGEGKFTAYGCDLGHTYVKINADYRS
ncbi:bifunctional glutamate N-acetyltransferase/amino-acid acetyltransferase ArgJ [Campylobacter hyointestinalis]|uniref:bifunctional glutamate N-acetyltransferase/amino-acid acetyltransferase ArgJ n=1 Tax=Campylobacter hyointestinalis TaxID=198 RepID=UPI000727F284|nr:bifunctional glutamate N-acetyltransferase/amino-acid acetyltransferase ArgJ [Campylobacter hyointestinalis]PPB52317.1 bifunctional ornithine acetyltransferase/N-acetylglutamate synthase [Campylobacter hyointestinalis subsp. hyointestinalis]PPB60380.1 bifunctional ornithine acetyltransferase/N-acetylglutamate synthase [Campylobacter hyointestinalis subsp. hyointestinalis]PPB61057.1 bifunctional ornithine acetyltransferase/N-acetylglutamate synthase [Campylobacter hyointestinalis subsp. hyoint